MLIPRLTNGVPRLKNRRRAWANTIVSIMWFLCIPPLFMLFRITPVSIVEVAGLALGIIVLVLLILKLVYVRIGSDPWTAGLFGFFGLMPLTLTLALTVNATVGRVEVLTVKAEAIVTDERKNRYFCLEGGRFSDHERIMLEVLEGSQAWYVDSVVYTLRKGVFGLDVLLGQAFVMSEPRKDLEARRRR